MVKIYAKNGISTDIACMNTKQRRWIYPYAIIIVTINSFMRIIYRAERENNLGIQ